MTERVPLSTLLSQALVAFTIEFDDEFEHQMPHRTTSGGARSGNGPWLVSQAMWSNCMQFVDEEGTPLRDLDGPARLTNLPGLERWGYVTIEPDPADRRPTRPRADWIVRPTRFGRQAQEIWRPLGRAIEERWERRFGADEVRRLRECLLAVRTAADIELPPYLPVLRYADGMIVTLPPLGRAAAGPRSVDAEILDVSTLLAQVLLVFTIEFERASRVSLAIAANVLRVLSEEPVRVRDLPRVSGTSREAISASLGFLGRRGHVTVSPDPSAGRSPVVRLTSSGLRAKDDYRRRLRATEIDFDARFDVDLLLDLRGSLERLVVDPPGATSALFEGMEAYPDGWRASVAPRTTLPHFPMVLHRGGFPDGS